MKIINDESLKKHTSYKIGGKIKTMLFPENECDISLLPRIIENQPYYIMSRGTNILFNDIYFDGIIVNMSKYRCLRLMENGRRLQVCSGVNNKTIEKLCRNKGIINLMFLAGVPGMLGGAVFMNAGAFGDSISQYIRRINLFDLSLSTFFSIDNPQQEYFYRGQKFIKDHHIILSCELELHYAKNKDEARIIADKNIKYRKEMHPEEPSAGSVFKNPSGHSVGKMVEDAGLKGRQAGGARISLKHGNFIINFDKKASFHDVLGLIKIIKEEIDKKYSLKLDTEIKIIRSTEDFYRL